VGHAAKQDRKGFDIEWREINHRTLGRNKIPIAVIFKTLEDILAYLGRKREAALYQTLFKEISGAYPELTTLLVEKPLAVLTHEGVWNQLLSRM
jgi:hypothetical protein